MDNEKIKQLVLEMKCLGEVAEVNGMTVEGNPLHPLINDAWQTIAALSQPAAVEGWISVKDALPPLETPVFLLNENHWMNTGSDTFSVNWLGAGWLGDFGSKYWSVIGEKRAITLDSVTHWRYVATLPQSEDARGSEPVAGYSMAHNANEWADMAINGLQWIRNIVDGISDQKAALENMESNLAHCREVSAKTDRPASWLLSEKVEPVVEFMGRRLTPENTKECWGFMLSDDLPRGTKLYTISPTATQALRMAAESLCDLSARHLKNGDIELGNGVNQAANYVCSLIPPASEQDSAAQGASESDQRKLGFAGAEYIGEMRSNGVKWFDKNPHAYPLGTRYFAVTTPPADTVTMTREKFEAKLFEVAEAAALARGQLGARKVSNEIRAIVAQHMPEESK